MIFGNTNSIKSDKTSDNQNSDDVSIKKEKKIGQWKYEKLKKENRGIRKSNPKHWHF